jgi:hypothetical protein
MLDDTRNNYCWNYRFLDYSIASRTVPYMEKRKAENKMKVKQIEVTINDSIVQSELDFLADEIVKLAESLGFTVIALVQEVEVSDKKENTVRVNDKGFTSIVGKKRRL